MDNPQAQLILSGYRPNGEDASDAFFAEALEQARHDPELERWFAQQRCFDGTMQSAVQDEAVPQQLHNTLLLNNKVDSQSSPAATASRFWNQPARWMVLAAALILFIGLGVFFRNTPATTMTSDQFAQHIIQLSETNNITLGKMATDTEELRTWLANQKSPHDFPIPKNLQALERMGCQSFEINGSKVSLICFMLDNNQLVHLFVIDHSDLRNSPSAQPTIIHEGTGLAATWSTDGRTYLLTGKQIDEATLRALI